MHRRSSSEVFERDFLETRAKILELAASLDRLERAGDLEAVRPDPRFETIQKALETLRKPGAERAETVQMLFSDPYDPQWTRELPHVRQ